jgi:hypothetical protein
MGLQGAPAIFGLSFTQTEKIAKHNLKISYFIKIKKYENITF